MEDIEKQIETSAIESANGAWNELDWTNGFIKGVKSEVAKQYWQQGLYTEEEVRELLIKCLAYTNIDILGKEFDNWFNKNKKK